MFLPLPPDIMLTMLSFLPLDAIMDASESSIIEFLLKHKNSKYLSSCVLSNIFDNPPLDIIKCNNAYELFSFLVVGMFKKDYLEKNCHDLDRSRIALLLDIVGNWRPLNIQTIFYYEKKILNQVSRLFKTRKNVKLSKYNLWLSTKNNYITSMNFWDIEKLEDQEIYAKNLNNSDELLLAKIMLYIITIAPYKNKSAHSIISEKYIIHYLKGCRTRYIPNSFYTVCEECGRGIDDNLNSFEVLYNRLNNIALYKFENKHYLYIQKSHSKIIVCLIATIFHYFEENILQYFDNNKNNKFKGIKLELLLKELTKHKNIKLMLTNRDETQFIDNINTCNNTPHAQKFVKYLKSSVFWILKLFLLVKTTSNKLINEDITDETEKLTSLYQNDKQHRLENHELVYKYSTSFDCLDGLYDTAINI